MRHLELRSPPDLISRPSSISSAHQRHGRGPIRRHDRGPIRTCPAYRLSPSIAWSCGSWTRSDGAAPAQTARRLATHPDGTTPDDSSTGVPASMTIATRAAVEMQRAERGPYHPRPTGREPSPSASAAASRAYLRQRWRQWPKPESATRADATGSATLAHARDGSAGQQQCVAAARGAWRAVRGARAGVARGSRQHVGVAAALTV